MARRGVLLGAAIALLAFNLRPAVASVGPVLPDIRADLALTGTAAALLTMLPVLCFGLLAPAAPQLARRFGIEWVLLGVLLVLVGSLFGRVTDGPWVLFAGTALAGGAIAVANVLIPPLIKRDFPASTGVMMGVYTMALSGSAAVAAGATVPIAELTGGGWRAGLAAWALPAVLAAAVWLPRLRSRNTTSLPPTEGRSPLRSPLAWQVTIFFGLQSLSFYAVLAWLPSIYRDHGYSPAEAGFLLAIAGLAQLPMTLLLPLIASRAANQVALLAAATLLIGAGLAGVLVAPTAAPHIWAILIGLGQGSCFALGLSLFVLRTGGVAAAARLSAMAQTIGYLLTAFGPLAVGLVFDLTGGWTVPLTLLLLLLVPQLVAGALAGRRRWLDAAGEVHRGVPAEPAARA